MARFVRFGLDPSYYNIDKIVHWDVYKRMSVHEDSEVYVITMQTDTPINSNGLEGYFDITCELGHYEHEGDALSAVIDAIEMPGAVGVVPHLDKGQGQCLKNLKNDAVIYDNGKFACVDITAISREMCE